MKTDHALPLGYVLVHGNRQYVIQQVLGAGGFGITYRVKSRVENVPVTFAIKELFMSKVCWREATQSLSYSPGATADVGNAIRSFVTEASRLNDNGLRHPNLVSISDVFRANNTAYYVMEYVDGQTLMASIRESRGGRPYDTASALAIMRPVLEALEVLHANQVTHLDIKPENILLDNDVVGDKIRPVIIDFGLSKHYDSNGDATSTLLTSGCSDGYAPIEQYNTLPRFTPQADVYAAAATLYTLLTARRPASAFDVNLEDIEADLRGNNVSGHVIAAIRRAMAKMKEQRTPTIAAFAADLGLAAPALHDTLPTDPADDRTVRVTPPAFDADDKTRIASASDSGAGSKDTISTHIKQKDPKPRFAKLRSCIAAINQKLRFLKRRRVIAAILAGLLLVAGVILFVNHFDTERWNTFQDTSSKKYGFKDGLGIKVIEPRFDDANRFSEGLAAVKKDGKWGYIDKSGEFVSEPRFYEAWSFSEGLAWVELDGKWGFIDKSGEFVSEPRFEDFVGFTEGLAAVELDGKWGFINKSGKIVIEPRFDDVSGEGFQEGLAAVKSNGKYGFINQYGKFVIEPRFDDENDDTIKSIGWHNSFRFSEGLAAVKLDGKWGYIDKSGEFVIEPRFDYAWNLYEGLAWVTCFNGKTGYVDKSGNFYEAASEDEARKMMEEKKQNKKEPEP